MNRHIYRPPTSPLYIEVLFTTPDTSIPVFGLFLAIQLFPCFTNSCPVLKFKMEVSSLILDSVTVSENSTFAKGATFFVNGDRDLPVEAVIQRKHPSKVSSYLCKLANFATCRQEWNWHPPIPIATYWNTQRTAKGKIGLPTRLPPLHSSPLFPWLHPDRLRNGRPNKVRRRRWRRRSPR